MFLGNSDGERCVCCVVVGIKMGEIAGGSLFIILDRKPFYGKKLLGSLEQGNDLMKLNS